MDDLIQTTSSKDLSDEYSRLKDLQSHNSVQIKRDTTSCGNGNNPKESDCVSLENNLHVGINKAGCWGSCCVSWSAKVHLSISFIQGKLEWCEEHCVQANHSCKIFGMQFEGNTFNFCTGSTSGCKSGSGPGHDEL